MNIPTDYAQVNLMITGAGAPNGAECTFGMKVDDFVGTPTDAANTVAVNWASAAVMDSITEQVSITGILVKFGPNATGPSALEAYNIPGEISNPCIPPNSSLLIHKATPAGGRAGSGRMYFPGPADDDVDDSGFFNTGRRDDVTAAMNDFLDKMSTDDLPLVLLHGVGSPITTPTFISSFSCDPKLATQRRRLRR